MKSIHVATIVIAILIAGAISGWAQIGHVPESAQVAVAPDDKGGVWIARAQAVKNCRIKTIATRQLITCIELQR